MPRAAATRTHARDGPTSYLSINSNFQLFLGTDRPPDPASNPNTTGNRSYTRARFLHHAGVITPEATG
jgi:hypothetical protein